MTIVQAREYQAKYKPSQLISGLGQTAIITGWTVKQTVAKYLQNSEYAVIGNLYSATRGISPLVRNLLLNPHVFYLVVINGTKEDKNAGSCQCLLDFFRHGFRAGTTDIGKDCWVINSQIPGYIDKEIEAIALENLRKHIKCFETVTISEAVALVKELATEENLAPWGNPVIFPEVEVLPTVLPGIRYGHRIEGKTIAQTWIKILHRIKTTGTIRPTGYDGKWQELIDLMAIVTDEPPEFYFPEPNYLPVDKSFIQEYISQILENPTYQEGVKYTYGQRLRSWFGRDQIEQVINKLIQEIDAASAVMSLWDVKDHETGGSPCLNHIWLRVVDNELSLTATLRSNDMFAAWPANAMGLRALQTYICQQINQRSDYRLHNGPLITISQSAHIYEDTWGNVDSLIANQYQSIAQQQDYADLCGNFLIEIEHKQIIVKQTTPGSGEVVSCYVGKNVLKLIREIAVANPAIQPAHIGYLGIELQKAYFSLINDQHFWQDS